MENISEHISYAEATYSRHSARLGTDNAPNPQQLKSMKLVAEKVFEPVRRHYMQPIDITSFFRNKLVNKAVGGAETSQHPEGKAIDCKGGKNLSNRQIFDFIYNNLDYDQLIWEHGTDSEPAWVHFSYSAAGNRHQTLRAKKIGKRTIYTKYI